MPKNLADLRRLLSKTKPWAAIAILFAMILATFYGFQGYRYWEARTEVEAANSQIETISRKLQVQVPNIDASEAELQRQQDLDMVTSLLITVIASRVNVPEPEPEEPPPSVLTLDSWLTVQAEAHGGSKGDVLNWLRLNDPDDLFGQVAGLNPDVDLASCMRGLDALLENMLVDATGAAV